MFAYNTQDGTMFVKVNEKYMSQARVEPRTFQLASERSTNCAISDSHCMQVDWMPLLLKQKQANQEVWPEISFEKKYQFFVRPVCIYLIICKLWILSGDYNVSPGTAPNKYLTPISYQQVIWSLLFTHTQSHKQIIIENYMMKAVLWKEIYWAPYPSTI